MESIILIVEDDAALWPMYRHVLKNAAYPLVFARNGDEAINKLETYQPILTFLDMRLPILNGEQILAHMKQSARLEHVPVVVTTSMREDELHIPVTHYLRKPILPDSIRGYAESLLHISA